MLYLFFISGIFATLACSRNFFKTAKILCLIPTFLSLFLLDPNSFQAKNFEIFYKAFLIAHFAIIGISNFQKNSKELIIGHFLASFAISLTKSHDLHHIFVNWELMFLCSSALIFISCQNSKQNFADAKFYFLINIFGSFLCLLGMSMHQNHGFMPHFELTSSHFASFKKETLAETLLATGILINCAIFPFSSWLTRGYNASSKQSFLFLSVFPTKSAILLASSILQGSEILFFFGFIMVFYHAIGAFLVPEIRKIICHLLLINLGFMLISISSSNSDAQIFLSLHAFSHLIYNILILLSFYIICESCDLKTIFDLKKITFKNSPFQFTSICISLYCAIGGVFSMSSITKQMLKEIFDQTNKNHLLLICSIISSLIFIKIIHNLIKKPENDQNCQCKKVPIFSKIIISTLASIMFCPNIIFAKFLGVSYIFLENNFFTQEKILTESAIWAAAILIYLTLPKNMVIKNMPEFDFIYINLPKAIFASIIQPFTEQTWKILQKFKPSWNHTNPKNFSISKMLMMVANLLFIMLLLI